MRETILEMKNGKRFVVIWSQKEIFIGTTAMFCSLAGQMKSNQIMKTIGWKAIPKAMVRTLDGIDCIAIGYEIPESVENPLDIVKKAIERHYNI